MKGTSGAVKRVFLRGTTRRAALGRPNGPSRAPTHDTAGRRQEVSRTPTGRGKSSSRERSRRCSWTALDVLPCPPEVRLASSRGGRPNLIVVKAVFQHIVIGIAIGCWSPRRIIIIIIIGLTSVFPCWHGLDGSP
jgi:hypothetical protein